MKKNLKDINLSFAYNSEEDNILEDFYIPALSSSISYKRIGGYFSSSSFALAARGLSNFINNEGKMKLIVNHILSEEDKEIIEKIDKDKELNEILIKKFEGWNLEDEIIKSHVKAFGWMMANDLLEFKIAISKKDRLFHQKVGILEDSKDNKISFSGSNNETASGWGGNIEEFKVFKSWEDGQKQYINSDESKFDKFWSNKSEKVKVVDAPEAIKKEIIKTAPKNFSELSFDFKGSINFEGNKDSKRNLSLRSVQKGALTNWKENDYKGILEMATGTGKTFTALSCLNSSIKNKDSRIIVVSAPYNHLLNQWNEELGIVKKQGIQKEFGELANITKKNKIFLGSTNSNWKQDLSNKLLDVENGLLDKLIIFTTHATLSHEFLTSKISSTKKTSILIVDEVHGIGAPNARKGLLDSYDLRLALSATPERWMDEEGSNVINNYFKGQVFEFNLSDAINKVNPDTGKTYLTPYNYNPYFIELTEEEIKEYKKITGKIGKLSHYKNKDENYSEKFERLLIKRADILKSAENKITALKNIISDIKKDHGSIKKSLVYCNDGSQLDDAEIVLNEIGIKEHKFTSNEGVRPEDKYGGLSERSKIIKDFEDDHYQALVAIKCLDEGVDIPSAAHGIILASSTNPKEYIQRRGRILRRYPGKKKAYIYDIIVIPPDINFQGKEGKAVKNIERNIYKKELRRYKEFADVAENSGECLLKIIDLEKKINIL